MFFIKCYGNEIVGRIKTLYHQLFGASFSFHQNKEQAWSIMSKLNVKSSLDKRHFDSYAKQRWYLRHAIIYPFFEALGKFSLDEKKFFVILKFFSVGMYSEYYTITSSLK